MDFSMMNMRGWATGTELFIISTAICEYTLTYKSNQKKNLDQGRMSGKTMGAPEREQDIKIAQWTPLQNTKTHIQEHSKQSKTALF